MEGGGFAADNPEFFKVLLPGFKNRLMIPPSFNKHIMPDCRQYHRQVTIWSPIGKPWHVKLQEDDGSLYFEEGGWPEFVKAHELRLGYFLVFCYKGNMHLTVKVFDRTACLKHYGLTAEKRKNYQVQCNLSRDKASLVSRQSNTAVESIQAARELPSSPSGINKSSQLEMIQAARELPSSPPGITKRSRRPHQFEKSLTPSNLSRFLDIPIPFCKANGMLRRTEVIIKDSKGGQWRLNFIPGKRLCHLGKGWMRFSSENNLKEGDRCLFELVSKTKKPVFHVEIIRKRDQLGV